MIQTTLKIELGIEAQKFTQQLQLCNKDLESSVEEGVKLAIEELLKDGSLVEKVKEQTKSEVMAIVRVATLYHDFRSTISTMVRKKIEDKIEEYCDKVASNLAEQLNK